MTKALTKVIYKPDTQSTDEYMVIVDPDEYKKWKNGDTTIPLAQVVDSFSTFHSTQGTQGILGKPSKQQLDTVFGTSKDVDVVTHILKNGREQASEGFDSVALPLNPARGSTGYDVKGKGAQGNF
jgi:ribosome maturation protein Sdo1